MEINFGVIFVFALFGGIVGAFVARAKGGDANAGFLWGFFLGPIGWIIAALVLNKAQSRDQRIKAAMAKKRAYEDAQAQKPKPTVADELTKLAALRDAGAITVAEFDQQKRRLLA